MSAFSDPVTISSSFLALSIVLILIKIFHILWWVPSRIQYLLGSQGIKGPSYRFIYGNTKEIMGMKKEAMATPMSLSSHAVLSKVLPHMDSWINIYGRNHIQWYGSRAQLIVAEPELIKEIFNNRDRMYPKIEMPAFIKKMLGDGLVSTESGKWSKLRKLADYAFHGESLKSMVPEMISSAELMLERWKLYEGKEIEVYEEFRILTSEVISRTAFGSSYLKGKDIFDMLTRLVSLASKNAYKFLFPGISKFYRTSDVIESDMLVKKIRKCIIEIIKEREYKVKSGEEDNFGSDFFGLLLKAHHDTNYNQRISVDDLVDECKTFYLAGQDTTNTLLAWTMFLLATHTDWQEKARAEVLNLFGRSGNPNPDGISKLKIMGMIINESLRLYPPVVANGRKVAKEVRLGKFILPSNLNLIVSTLAIHHDPQIWGKDVHQFKPERFSGGVAEATKNNLATFLPFGMGPRNCVGNNFAITEAKITLSMILQRYSFTLSPAYVHLPIYSLTIRPKHGIQVILHPL
ncbi:cytochrome P450 CYP749A22-like [Ziziphus jujuba]|uniref:Cytochrome P450 CYP749A22-like n=1 Tax=Ziziphus jujuba TaxID=326968 RepID=A0ABM3ZXK1_ZIZJJ|nr:cytochrome P450 CYP749A22-like [Ziziphus jujuba]